MKRSARIILGLILALTVGQFALFLVVAGILFLMETDSISHILGICSILVGIVIISIIAFLLFFKTKRDKEEAALIKKARKYSISDKTTELGSTNKYNMRNNAIGYGNDGPINVEEHRATRDVLCKDYDPKGKLGFKIKDIYTLQQAMLKRSKKLHTHNLLIVICIVYMFSGFIIGPLLTVLTSIPANAATLILFFSGFAGIWLVLHNKDYWENLGSSAYGDIIVKPAIARIMSNAFFKHDSYMEPSRLNDTHIIQRGNRHEGGYHIFLQTGSNYFEYCNYHEWYYRRGGKNRSSTRLEYFDGCVLSTNFNTNKVSNYVRIVCSNTFLFHQELQGYWPRKASEESLVDVESIHFNENYQVYSVDPMDAYMLLTPSVIEKIDDIRKMYSDFTILVGNGNIILAINKTKLLSTPTSVTEDTLREINCETQIYKIIDVITALRTISSYLNEKD